MATEETIHIADVRVSARRCNTVVVGSGAAGLSAVEYLHRHGPRDVCLVTEGLELGTSRNTGSDKQTYYRLTLCGEDGDSVRAAGRTLFGGGAMDGDIALAEAAGSAQCFYRLVDLGVPFPENAFGEFAGYKTDHDPLKRGSSCGPLTSQCMTQCLLRAVRERGVEIFDKRQVIEILVAGKTCLGVLCLNLGSVADADARYSLFVAENVIYATGGEAGMYEMSVYPPEQSGSTGVALRAGVPGKNLTESQYGITSVKFRWNLSGTYQQVLPRYVSTDADGGDEREFLDGHFAGAGKVLEAVFLKGYQWPFDPRKIAGGGSSLVDILVHHEIVDKDRRVWLDYTKNPACAERNGAFDAALLTPVVHEYLANSDALLATPFRRLERMNPAAVELYKNHGIDLASERLEIAVSTQHNNGGLAGDVWWQSPVKGFFPVGEVNGSHGVYRPGGSALNSGQVGGMRAARYILARSARDGETEGAPGVADAVSRCREQLEACLRFGEDALRSDAPAADLAGELTAIRRRMSRHGAHIRSRDGVREALREAKEHLARIESAGIGGIGAPEDLRAWHQLRDFAVCHFVYLSAIEDYIAKGGGSRGSYLIHDPSGSRADPSLPDVFTFKLDDGAFSSTIQEITYTNGGCVISWRGVRPFPEADDWFETVWRRFREGEIYT